MLSGVGGFADESDIEGIVGSGPIDETADGRPGVEDVTVGEVEVLELKFAGTHEAAFFADIEEEVHVAVFGFLLLEHSDGFYDCGHAGFVIGA